MGCPLPFAGGCLPFPSPVARLNAACPGRRPSARKNACAGSVADRVNALGRPRSAGSRASALCTPNDTQRTLHVTRGRNSNFAAYFRAIYFRGIPRLLNDDGAYLSFGCSFSGTEALAGYRYPRENANGVKFKDFLWSSPCPAPILFGFAPDRLVQPGFLNLSQSGERPVR